MQYASAAAKAPANVAQFGLRFQKSWEPWHLEPQSARGYLADRVAGYDVVVSCQDVAGIYPALERLHWHPPLIEYGCLVVEAMAGPNHLTTRYVGASPEVREAAAARMPGREGHAIHIPSGGQGPEIAGLWMSLFEEVVRQHEAAPALGLFRSRFQDGFECSSHRLPSGRRLDVLAASGRFLNATSDYRRLAADGMLSVRDGVWWHLIQPSPGARDWSKRFQRAECAFDKERFSRSIRADHQNSTADITVADRKGAVGITQ